MWRSDAEIVYEGYTMPEDNGDAGSPSGTVRFSIDQPPDRDEPRSAVRAAEFDLERRKRWSRELAERSGRRSSDEAAAEGPAAERVLGAAMETSRNPTALNWAVAAGGQQADGSVVAARARTRVGGGQQLGEAPVRGRTRARVSPPAATRLSTRGTRVAAVTSDQYADVRSFSRNAELSLVSLDGGQHPTYVPTDADDPPATDSRRRRARAPTLASQRAEWRRTRAYLRGAVTPANDERLGPSAGEPPPAPPEHRRAGWLPRGRASGHAGSGGLFKPLPPPRRVVHSAFREAAMKPQRDHLPRSVSLPALGGRDAVLHRQPEAEPPAQRAMQRGIGWRVCTPPRG